MVFVPRHNPRLLSDVVLELLSVGKKPNLQLLQYLDLAIACQAIPLCAFIRAVHGRYILECSATVDVQLLAIAKLLKIEISNDIFRIVQLEILLSA